VTGRQLTTTPDHSDDEDVDRRPEARKLRDPEYEDRKNVTKDRNDHALEEWKNRLPECVDPFEDELKKSSEYFGRREGTKMNIKTIEKMNCQGLEGWKNRGPECVDGLGQNGLKKSKSSCGSRCEGTKNTKVTEDKNGHTLEGWKTTTGPECVDGYEDDISKARLMEDKFKEKVLRLQQQLGITAKGYVVPW